MKCEQLLPNESHATANVSLLVVCSTLSSFSTVKIFMFFLNMEQHTYVSLFLWHHESQIQSPSGPAPEILPDFNYCESVNAYSVQVSRLSVSVVWSDYRREHFPSSLQFGMKSLRAKVCGCVGTGSVLQWLACPTAFLFNPNLMLCVFVFQTQTHCNTVDEACQRHSSY